MEKIKVNEIFGPTIQGEGASTGKEVLFLRLAICNLSCTWCDSKHSWDWKHYDKEKEIHPMEVSEIIDQFKKLSNIKSLVISGGEPLLQQKQLIPLLAALKADNWWIEIETNGTVEPLPEVVSLLDQINCSPKLSNSGDSQKRRIKSEPLMALSSYEKTYFKFVVGTKQDIEEILFLVNDFDMKQVFLMPLGLSKEELAITTPLVEEVAKEYGFMFSKRLHIELFGTKRGV